MLPRRTIIAAERSRLRAAKPSDRAQWKTSLAVAVIWIAAAAGSLRAVAAAGRVLVFATNRVGRAAAIAARHQVIWTASDTAASISATTETAKTQRPRCTKADKNPSHPHTVPQFQGSNWSPRRQSGLGRMLARTRHPPYSDESPSFALSRSPNVPRPCLADSLRYSFTARRSSSRSRARIEQRSVPSRSVLMTLTSMTSP